MTIQLDTVSEKVKCSYREGPNSKKMRNFGTL